MEFDAALPPSELIHIPELARAAEAAGFAAVWTSETAHAPFLPHALIAEHSQCMRHGTAVAIAFARSPGEVAYVAWDLAAVSKGRFILGLGTQVKAHIERRFGLGWPEHPAQRFREFVESLRALWHAWQTGERLNYRGEHYKLALMTPLFDPGPIDYPEIPIFLAGVNPTLCRLAGELAQGFHVHPLHSAEYLGQVVRPAIADGAARAGRLASEVQVTVSVFTATDPAEADGVRRQLAFYASTPSYRPVLERHGFGAVADRLSGLARRAAWDDMPGLISDDMLETYAVVARPDELAAALRARYSGLADRLMLYRPFSPAEAETFWEPLRKAMAVP
jgi:probable F420-dependent oxidoreductase